MSKFTKIIAAGLFSTIVWGGAITEAAPQLVTNVVGTYRMGDKDTFDKAKRGALLDAKRNAIERVGVIVESSTTTNMGVVDQDEINSAAVAKVAVEGNPVYELIENGTVYQVTINAVVDPDVITAELNRMRSMAQQPAYPQHAAYPAQAAYPPQAAYPAQPAYPPQAAYPAYPAYPPQQVQQPVININISNNNNNVNNNTGGYVAGNGTMILPDTSNVAGTRQDLTSDPNAKVGASNYKGHMYKAFNNSLTWDQAKTYCEQNGGHLATISDAGEQKFVADLIKQRGVKNCYWIGAQRRGNMFTWIDGTGLNYKNWGKNQPDNWTGSENAVMMYRNTNPLNPNVKPGEWNDGKNDGDCNGEAFFGLDNFGFVCEWDY